MSNSKKNKFPKLMINLVETMVVLVESYSIDGSHKYYKGTVVSSKNRLAPVGFQSDSFFNLKDYEADLDFSGKNQKLGEDDLENLIEEIFEMVIDHVEKLAIKILNENKELDYFMMAMGSCFFVDKNGGTVYPKQDGDCAIKPLSDFIDKYNFLKITGEAMKISSDGKKITNW